MEKISRMSNGNEKPRKSTSWSIKRMAAILLALTWPRHFMALVLTTLRRNMQLKNRRHYMHVDGRQKTVFTVLRGRLCLMYVMHLSTMTMLPPLAQMPNRDGRTGMKTILWDINVIPNRAGQGIPYSSSWSSTHESFGRFTLFHHLSYHPMTLAAGCLCWCVCLFVCLLFRLLCLFVSCFASVMGFSQILRAY